MVANGIAAAYSSLQSVRCVAGSMKGSVLFSKPLAWAIFSVDQVSESSLVCVSFSITVAKTSEVAVIVWLCRLDLNMVGPGRVKLGFRYMLKSLPAFNGFGWV